MSLSDRGLHLRPIPCSREENQERAFIAASRRKDRSLDARVKSANRASSLHKHRTGKALYITKKIVEEEGMYEEFDERYQAKRNLMLQSQTLQIKEQFYRHLLAGFPGRPKLHSRGPSIASRRANNLAFRLSMKDNLQKLSLDLSSINSSFSHGVATLAGTTASADTHVPSPNTSVDSKMQPCIPWTNDPKIPVTILATPFFCADLREDVRLRGNKHLHRPGIPWPSNISRSLPLTNPYGQWFGSKLAATDNAPSPSAHPHHRAVAAVQGMPHICPRVTPAAPGSTPALTF
ncbi:hypothetical protein PENFLA_c100G05184 [Penicillium flavigenum]|uniref:Uncharacterized protein n=1 Tax=Penicillium flavigenum TaxID=254877 RepID=A0A1V6S7Y2_9EURO|nr:hypothetical protein PENFLA_c100G05184 [Penicillium flavigenum]